MGWGAGYPWEYGAHANGSTAGVWGVSPDIDRTTSLLAHSRRCREDEDALGAHREAEECLKAGNVVRLLSDRDTLFRLAEVEVAFFAVFF